MRILFVTQRYHPFVGGVETQTRLVVNELARRHHVEVAATKLREVRGPLPARFYPLTENVFLPSSASYQDGDVPVHALTPTAWERLQMAPIAVRSLPLLPRYKYEALQRFGYRWFRRVYVPKLKALMEDVDIVHSVAGGYLGWAAQEAARELGHSFVCTPYVHPGQHGDDAMSVEYYRQSDAVLALLETDREVLVDLGVPRDLIHLYGVVPLLDSAPDPEGFRERHGLGTGPVVLFVGRMASYKGVQALRDAAPHIWSQFPDAHFVFVGPVSETQKEEYHALDDRIHVLGFVDAKEKASAYAAATVFCMPSKFEILPAVYLEAWSHGVPVVGGPAHGLDALIEGNGAGLVVDQTPDAVAAALQRLLADPQEAARMGQRGADMVRDRYSTNALVGTLESVYESVRSPHPVHPVAPVPA